MVDFEGGKRGGFDRDESVNDALLNGSNEYQDSPASVSAGTRIMVADANGVVTLPAGTTLDDFAVQGRDLVIRLADGSTIVIPDGAINTPQIVIDGTAIPPMAVSAALNGLPMSPDDEGFNPDVLPAPPPSSGGDFDDGDLFLQDAFDLGNLLPYTELAFEPEPEEEIIPFENEEPEVVIETPDNPIGVENAIATVAERGLPERGDEPEGTADETNAETTTGTIIFNAPDGLSAIILNGVEITTVGQEFVTPFGTLTITSINLATGEIGFSYTLADNLLGETEDGNFFVTVIDRDGDSADASLKILVEDDSPIAADDIGIVPGGTFGPINGNVLDNDESGADDYPEGEEGPDAVTGFTSVSTGGTADPGDSLQGEYGVLTLNADGSYTYVRDFNTPGGVTEDFTYTIIDQDGSTSTATLTINIDDAPNTIEIPTIGEGTVVEESGLPERGDPLEPEGTDEPSDGETTTGTITFNSPDGLGGITINGVNVNLDNLAGNDADDQIVVDDETGILVITSVTYDPVTGEGSVSYEFTLGDNTDGEDTSVSFEVVVTDLDDDVASDDLVITIIDDAPLAEPDTDSVKEDGPLTASGNVITDAEANGDNGADTVGADGADVTGVIFGTSTDPVSGGVGTAVAGDFGSLTLNADGSYTYTLDNDNPLVQGLDSNDSFTETFTYTITDGDGDPATTTLTITINGNDDPVVIEGLDLEVPEVSVDEDDLPDGTDTTKESLTQPEPDGTFTFTSVDGLVTLQIGSKTFTAAELLDANTFPTDITGDYGTLTIQGVSLDQAPDGSIIGGTITYDYTLSQNTLDHDEAGEDDVIDDFLVRVEDTDGSFDEASLDVQVVDDIPLAGENADVQLDDDALAGNPGGTGDVDPDSDNLAGTLAHNFGADGAGTIDFASMHGESVEINGVTVTFTWAGDTLTANDGTNDVFSVQVNPATGEYTVTQLAPLTHHLTGDDVETDASFVLTYTITDGDDDFTTGTLTVNLNDDTPEFGEAEGSAPVLVTDDTLAEGGSDSDSASFAGAFAPLFGADGQAASDALVYSLAINGGDGTDSGLNDSVTDENILLRVSVGDPNVIEAYLETSGDIAFTLTLDPVTGEITQEQFRAIEHDNPNDPEESGAEAETMAAGLISLTATITDGDGDQASQSIDIGDSFTFEDDFGLNASIFNAQVDEDDLSNGNGDSAPGDDAGPAIVTNGFTVDFGADGPGADELTVAIAGVTATDPFGGVIALTSGGVAVVTSWDAATNTLTGYTTDINDPVFTAEFDFANSEWTFSLFQPLDHPSTDDGSGTLEGYEDNIVLNWSMTFVDGDGDTFTTNFGNVSIDDDMAIATDNSNSLGEGDDVSGNVVSDNDGDGVDAAGADGYASDGPVVDAEFDSANQGITFTSKTVDPVTGAITIVTSAGTLTLETDGSYTFDSDANSINGDAEIVFTYTIEDGDGDMATASLTIDVTNVGGTATAGDLLVDEKGLADGTGELADQVLGIDPNPISDQSEIDSGSIVVSGGSGTLTYTLVGGAFDDGGTPGDATDDTYTVTTQYGTIVLNAFTGEYTYTLNEEFDHDAPLSGAVRNTAPDVESFDYVVVDELNNVIVDSRDPGGDPIKVSIIDDIPEVDINATGDNPDAMLTFDEETVGGTSVDTADFSGAFNADSFLFGADGAGTLDTIYALVLASGFTEGDASGLFSDGAPVHIWQLDDGTIIGTTSNSEPADLVDTTDFVFTLSVDANTGIVTLTQYAELDHSVTDTAPDYDGDTIPLPGGLIEIEATATIVDFDQDEVTDTASIDLGDFVDFADDGPFAAISASGVSVSHDETPGNDGDADDTSDVAIIALFAGVTDPGVDPDMPAGYAVSDNGLSAVGSDFGADGAGDTVFSLDVSSDGVDSGLNVTNGDDILLFKEGDLIVGRVGNQDGDAAFAIAIDSVTGEISVVQYLSIDHPTGGASHDESLSIANGALLGVVTVTDEEGDSDTADIAIGGAVSFQDDGPSVSAVIDSASTVTVDETDLVQGAATIDLDGNTQGNDSDVTGSPTIVGSSTGNGVLDITPDFGADGELAGGGIDYNLLILSSTSGLTTTDGTAINLVAHTTNSDIVLGVVEGTDIIAFAIEIDSVTGEIKVEQYLSIQHADENNPNDPAQLATGSLAATVTVTDGDDDVAVSSEVDITSLITFLDDGPSVTIELDAVADVLLDESGLGAGAVSLTVGSSFTAGNDPDVAGSDALSIATSGSAVVDFATDNPLYGADGQGAAPVYSLQLDAVGPLTNLKLTDGSTITLVEENGIIFGVVDGGTFAGQAAFAIAIDSSTGVVTVEQYLSLQHPDNPNNHDEAVALDTGAISVVVTVEDGDDDTADSNGIDISGNITFKDDGPSVTANNIDDDSVMAVTSDADIPDSDATQTVADLFSFTPDYGADGQGAAAVETYGIDLVGDVDLGAATVGIDSGFTSGGDTVYLYQNGNSVVASTAALFGDVLAGNTVFTVAVDPSTGALTLSQTGVLDHTDDGSATDTQLVLGTGLINATYSVTVTDGDDDTANDMQTADLGGNIKFNDDVPTAQNATVTVQVDEDELPGGNTDNDGVDTVESGSLNALVDFGNDTPGSFSFSMAGFVDPNLTSGGDPVNWGVNADGKLVGYTGGDITDTASHVIVIELVETGGSWTTEVTLLAQIDHLPNNPANDDNQMLTFGIGAAIVATDFDGDDITLANGAVSVAVEDDIPVNFSPVDLTDTTDATVTTQDDALVNSGMATATRLINDPDNDGIGTNFIGADGFGSLTFTGGTDGVTTLETTVGDPITSGGDTIFLFGFGTGTLIGTTDPTNTDAGAQVFEVTLNTGTGAGDDATYSIEFFQTLDDGSGFVFDDFSTAPAGQNQWIGLDADGNDIDVDNNDSEDLLITPINGTVNTSATDIGNANQWIDNNEGIRLDFVEDVRRGPGQDEKDAGGYQHDGHYDVTNASFTIMQVGGGGTDAQVTIALFDDDGVVANGLAPDPVEVDPDSIEVRDSGGNLLTEGVDYDVIDNGLTVTVTGLSTGDQVSFEAMGDAAFNATSFTNDGGGDRFALGVFGFNSAVSGNDLTFNFDVLATDGDGDTSTGTIDITVTPDTSVTPVVLDLDGGGNEFTSLSGGFAYDYNGDGVKTQTAWIAAGSAILAFDANGDGIVNNASEFVFGGNGMTDLEAIAAKYDSNSDGKLDAADSAYGKFGVWIDADLDAVSDAGEFVTLADAGITSIQLVSDGIPTIEADGDVTVYGTSSFTMEDGSTGEVSDAGFATGSDVDPAMMEALLALQTLPEPVDANLADATGMDGAQEVPKLATIVDDVLAGNTIDALLDNLAGNDADFVGISGEGGYLGDGALAQMIETGAFAFTGNMMADLHEDAAALATIHA